MGWKKSTSTLLNLTTFQMRMGQPYANPNTQKSYNLAGETLTPDKKNKIGTYSKRQKKYYGVHIWEMENQEAP